MLFPYRFCYLLCQWLIAKGQSRETGHGPAPHATITGMRTEWISPRLNDPIRTQMHYARQGVVTEEMRFIAARERLEPELIGLKWRAGA